MRIYDVIFWDLDGTLIDPRLRLYTLFRELTGCSLSFDSYWSLKARGIKQKKMLAYIGYKGDASAFHQLWLQNVERIDLLKKDSLIADIKKILQQAFAAGCKMYVVTNRQSLDHLLYQLDFLGIGGYFQQALTTEQNCTKSELVNKSGIALEKGRAVFIGDSEEDINAASALGIDSVLLTKNSGNIAATYYAKDAGELKNILLQEM